MQLVADSFPKYSEFKVWFVLEKNNEWSAVNKQTGNKIADWNSKAEYQIEFERFLTRPEAAVGKQASKENMVLSYETLLVGASLIRCWAPGVDPDTYLGAIMKCIEWLTTTDFYVCPASTRYHGSYASGLLEHSLDVYNVGLSLRNCDKFKDLVDIASFTVCALAHDWCKIGMYEEYTKNVKNEDTGKWESVAAYRTNMKGVPLGHGVTSMFLAGRCFKLSTEEALAIRWHMGAWRVVDSEMDELQAANEKFPLVHLLQFADQLSIVSY